jgi:hypothetical protein
MAVPLSTLNCYPLSSVIAFIGGVSSYHTFKKVMMLHPCKKNKTFLSVKKESNCWARVCSNFVARE